MCGIGAILSLDSTPVEALAPRLGIMNRLLEHRGPDGEGMWTHDRGHVGFAHRRLAIIDLVHRGAADARRPGTGSPTTARSTTTSSCAAARRGRVPHHLGHGGYSPRVGKGTAAWTSSTGCSPWPSGTSARAVFCARDRFGDQAARTTPRPAGTSGIRLGDQGPRSRSCRRSTPSSTGLKEYLTFQFCLAGKTLFTGGASSARSLAHGRGRRSPRRPVLGHRLPGGLRPHGRLFRRSGSGSCLEESVRLQIRSDVPLGAYCPAGSTRAARWPRGTKLSVTEIHVFRAGSPRARATTRRARPAGPLEQRDNAHEQSFSAPNSST